MSFHEIPGLAQPGVVYRFRECACAKYVVTPVHGWYDKRTGIVHGEAICFVPFFVRQAPTTRVLQ